MKIDIIYFDAGGGHRAAATALELAIAQRGLGWTVRLVHLQEVLDKIDIFRQVFRLRLEDVYNLLLRKGWTLGSGFMLKVMHFLIRLYHPLQVWLLKKHWEKDPPDVVLSVVPNFDRALYQAWQQVKPGAPYVTVITDLADFPPHFWLEAQKQIVFCGTAKAEAQAKEILLPGSTIIRTSGMVLHPRFYEPITADRAAELTQRGLDPALPTGIILFGGYGSSVMPSIIERLAGFAGRVQFIVICGKNEKLRQKFLNLETPLKLHIEGFTKQVPLFMHLSDFMIGKPGPGSISEALHMKLPVIVERNAFTLPQERYNADFVKEYEVGLVLDNFQGIAAAVDELLVPANLARFQANAAAMRNRAVFEIPAELEKLLS
ncbi:MAG: galactosyldiacylglycerol synthase [Bryobacteraceae bacterium]|nr:galactosyldiacylglycerol synthase [Bryobacteraceae bacterium]